MNFITILAVALGLSFDTFAVSLSYGVIRKKILFIHAMHIAMVLAAFQAGFLVAGYFLGALFTHIIEAADHWVALILLTLLGTRMIIEGIKSNGSHVKIKDSRNSFELVAAAVATSIDALAVGISFALLEIRIWYSAVIIGAVTFIASMIAIRAGKSAGERLENKVEILGGLILIAVGVKIFLEHTLGT